MSLSPIKSANKTHPPPPPPPPPATPGGNSASDGRYIPAHPTDEEMFKRRYVAIQELIYELEDENNLIAYRIAKRKRQLREEAERLAEQAEAQAKAIARAEAEAEAARREELDRQLRRERDIEREQAGEVPEDDLEDDDDLRRRGESVESEAGVVPRVDRREDDDYDETRGENGDAEVPVHVNQSSPRDPDRGRGRLYPDDEKDQSELGVNDGARLAKRQTEDEGDDDISMTDDH
ncbi:hypothetical protein IAT40_001275 [Kwoniella sp. CBS 6097]